MKKRELKSLPKRNKQKKKSSPGDFKTFVFTCIQPKLMENKKKKIKCDEDVR